MFGHKQKLLSNGAQTEGVVFKAWTHQHRQECVRVRVKFPDGSTGEFEQGGLWRPKVGTLIEGDVVPIRYDPADDSKVTLDVPLMEQRHAEAWARQFPSVEGRADAVFEQLGTDGTDAPSS